MTSKLFKITVIVRGLVFCSNANPHSSTPTFKTSNSTDYIATFEVSSDISFFKFRESVLDACLQKGLSVDPNGKLFIAQSKISCNMIELHGQLNLNDYIATAKKNRTSLRCGFGAFNEDNTYDVPAFDPHTSIYYASNLPPVLKDDGSIKVSAKLSAKANTTVVISIKNFIESLYSNENSPFYHGFTRYHYGVLLYHFTNLENAGHSAITDVQNNIFPSLNQWDSFHPDGHWRSPKSVLDACNTVMERGKFPPDRNNQIPMADFAKKREIAITKSGVARGEENQNPNSLLLQRLIDVTIQKVGSLSPAAVTPLAVPAVQITPTALQDKQHEVATETRISKLKRFL